MRASILAREGYLLRDTLAAIFMTDHVFKWTEFALGHGTRLLAILLIALFLVRLLRILTRRLIAAAGSQSAARVARMREQQTQTLAGILYSGGTAIIIVVAVLTALPEFGFNITPVAAAAGLASLSIGFGAQHIVRDFINGFFAVLEDQYVVGDVVRIGDVVGRVEHMTLRRTVLRDPQGAVVTIPNGEIARVANLSRDWGQLFLDAVIAADQPLDDALNAFEAVASEFRADPSWSPMLLDGPRVLGVESLAPNGTTVRMQVRTAPTRQDDVARELRRRMQMELAGRGIQLGGLQRMQLVSPDRDRVARD
jgi:moderate conductance mechanosensitive channel